MQLWLWVCALPSYLHLLHNQHGSCGSFSFSIQQNYCTWLLKKSNTHMGDPEGSQNVVHDLDMANKGLDPGLGNHGLVDMAKLMVV